MTTDKQNKEPRNVLSDSNVHMKCITFENKDGGYFIGNCNLNLGLKNTVLRFIPPDEEGQGAKVVIINSTYNNKEFELFLDEAGELEGLIAYFHGLCNMDINTMNTVFKFFPERFEEKNVLIIQQTQKREDGKRITNPIEVKIYMRHKGLHA